MGLVLVLAVLGFIAFLAVMYLVVSAVTDALIAASLAGLIEVSR